MVDEVSLPGMEMPADGETYEIAFAEKADELVDIDPEMAPARPCASRKSMARVHAGPGVEVVATTRA